MTTCRFKIALCARAAAVLAVVGIATASHAQTAAKYSNRQAGEAATLVRDKNSMQFVPTNVIFDQDPVGGPQGGAGPRGEPEIICTQSSGDPLGNCHNFEFPRVAGTSPLSAGAGRQRMADQFRTAVSGDLTADQVCWWGTYGVATCGTEPPDSIDKFVIAYYNLDGGTGLPIEPAFATFRQDLGQLTVAKRHICDVNLRSSTEHTGSHAALALAGNTCYWIEIRNETNGTQNWFWSRSINAGSNYDGTNLIDLNGVYELNDATLVNGDRAFCVNVDQDTSPLGVANGCTIVAPPPTCVNPNTNGQPRGADNGFGLFSASPSAAAVGLQLAERFQSTTSGNIEEICFWGFWVSIATGAIVPGPPAGGARFDVTFFDNNNGQPGNVIQAFQVNSGGTTVTAGPANGWRIDLGGGGFPVTAGTCYFFSISILSEAANANFNLRWGWGGASAVEAVAIRDNFAHSRTAAGATNPGVWANQIFAGPPCNDIHYLFNIGPVELPNCPVTAGACCVGQACSITSMAGCGGVFQGTGTTCIAGRTCIPAPSNDECASPSPIAGLGSFPFDSRPATDSAGTPSCATIGSDVWYSWQAPCDGDFTFDTCGTIAAGNNGDTVLAVYANDCTTELGCSDDNCNGANSTVTLLGVISGTDLRIRIGTFGNGSTGTTGTFQISRAGGACPAAGGACCCGSACTNVANAGLCVTPGGGIPVSFLPGGNCNPFSVVTPCCRADVNRSGGNPTPQDIFSFLALFFSPVPAAAACADFNASGGNPSPQDIFDFLAAFFRPGGCAP